jgi:hypothetical protein
MCQSEWKFALGERDKAIVKYKELLKKTASEASGTSS